MSLTAREIAAVVAELAPLAGAHVEAVRVHAERALTLSLRGRAGEALLLLSAEPDVTRLHVAARRPRQPDAPFPFQALLRRELEGARLTALVRLGPLVRHVRGDAQALPFRARAFDAAVSQEGLLHVPDKAAVLAECARVLKPGARIAFTDWIARPLGLSDRLRYSPTKRGLTSSSGVLPSGWRRLS